MGRIIEGVWDCKSCGNTEIKANQKNCPHCGAPQDKDTKFRLPGQISYVPKEEESKISKLPDWECPYCGSLNKATDTICRNCGSSKSDSNNDYFDLRRIENEKEYKKESFENSLDEFEENIEDKNSYTSKSSYNNVPIYEKSYTTPIKKQESTLYEKVDSFFNKFQIPIIAGLVVILAILIISAIMPKYDTLQVNGFSWQRTIDIEEEKTFEESDWYLPSGAKLKYTNEEIKSYRQVLDHYETVTVQKSREVPNGSHEVVTGYRDLGNGYFEEITSTVTDYTTEYYTETEQQPVYRDEPVYETKYYYSINRWVHKRYIETSGDDKNPYWGEVVIGDNEREGQRSERYQIIATNSKNEEKTYSINYKTWTHIEKDSKLSVKLVFGNISAILDSEGNEITFE